MFIYIFIYEVNDNAFIHVFSNYVQHFCSFEKAWKKNTQTNKQKHTHIFAHRMQELSENKIIIIIDVNKEVDIYLTYFCLPNLQFG